MQSGPVIVGLLGGIASGKSTVARIFEELGARRIDADRIAHDVLESPGFSAELIDLFGEEAHDDRGGVDRKWIAEQVFGDEKRLKQLEAALHPRVRARIRRAIDAADDGGIVVLDAPLLLEGGLGHLAHCLVYVETPRDLRFARAREHRGWSLREVARRERHQMALSEKKKRADYRIRNDGDLEKLEIEVRKVRDRILGDRPAGGSTHKGEGPDGA